jgi:hypothetical protein
MATMTRRRTGMVVVKAVVVKAVVVVWVVPCKMSGLR